MNTEPEPDGACTAVLDVSGCRVRATPIDRIRRPLISSSGNPFILCDGLRLKDMPQSAAPSGLCDTCAHARRVASARGSAFILCARSKDDPRFPKYPRLPMIRCAGFESSETVPRR
jgi:hypothetical protein